MATGNGRIPIAVASLAVVIAMGSVGWALYVEGKLGDVRTEAAEQAGALKERLATMQATIDQLKTDNDKDQEQDRRLDDHRRILTMHWQIHSWTKKHINQMYADDGRAIVDWPQFTNQP